MKAVFIGASSLTVMTARVLLERGQEVIIVERDKQRIDELSQDLACGFVCGDGTFPSILREVNAEAHDFLYCLTGNDQANIICSLVGRSLEFGRIVTKIVNPEFVHICIELGLEDVIVPSSAMGRYLADKFAGRDLLELSGMIKHEARIFSFVVRPEDAGPVERLHLPEKAQVICIYRDNMFRLSKDTPELKVNDEVVLIAHSSEVAALRERWAVPRKRIS